MSAADRYREMVERREAQQLRVAQPLNEARWAQYAPSYRFDPFREPEPVLSAAIPFIRSTDDLLEVGGGAGRMGLPLLLRASSLVNVEPSPAMRAQFERCVADHEIQGARAIDSRWPMTHAPTCDVALTADVTYFIADIAAFIQAMHDSARRRVIIFTWSVPPPNVNADLFELAFAEPEAPSPSFRELLPAIWKLGIVPDVMSVDEWFTWPERLPSTDDEALAFALEELAVRNRPAAAAALRPHIGELFERGQTYRPRWRTPSQGIHITWTT